MTITYLRTLVVEKVKKCANYKKQCTLFSFDVNHNHTTISKINVLISSPDPSMREGRVS